MLPEIYLCSYSHSHMQSKTHNVYSYIYVCIIYNKHVYRYRITCCCTHIYPPIHTHTQECVDFFSANMYALDMCGQVHMCKRAVLLGSVTHICGHHQRSHFCINWERSHNIIRNVDHTSAISLREFAVNSAFLCQISLEQLSFIKYINIHIVRYLSL